ncbi:MAG TPA: acetylglutamate kinase [Rhodospirillaceae bacterium]|nr:acetylglutamate kinase [Rhodospirillaceae bacterium]MAX62595.1 acetylglutamate kinase [Rhodospirillaceae bacterium]MBB56995.1 acetylglutamate kinase [Rhodospirillaceae bacterium]HAE01528.1 acetylglutamate kinase [Rhodospirillaceae bacterium]HAJ20684.1 acetylglutamate kinase [Rhodospirillaceae bacterium]
MTKHMISLDAIEEIAQRHLNELPEEFRQYLGDIVFRVQDLPDAETIEALELASPYDLLGLYHGVDMASKSVMDPQPDIDMIFLYRLPMLDFCQETGEDLNNLVRHVLVHEIGHHFGLSDDDMQAIEDEE